jgi:flagellar biosynthesis protein FlhF
MRLRIYRAATIAEAMGLIRAELGAEALIMSTRRVAQGVEVSAALEQPEPDPAWPQTGALQAAPVFQNPARIEPAPSKFPPPEFSPARGLPWHPSADRGLIWHGIPADIAQRLATGSLADNLAATLRFGALPLAPRGPALLLAGPPGAGKTLTVARLATRLVLAGMPPLVVTADGRRAGAAEELAAYTRLLGIELVVACTPASLARALQRRVAGAPVLIDTAGVSPFAPAQMGAVAALVAAVAAIPVLVLPAGQDPQEAADHAAAFAATGVRHLLPTRLDMARRLGSIVTAAIAGGMALSEAGTSASANDGLSPLTPAFLAARLAQSPQPRTPASTG